jgi:preprotein translocase subunit YajC
MNWTGLAYAMGVGGDAAAGQGGGFGAMVPLLLMFAIFYFLLIRPQQTKQKKHRELLSKLAKGDMVVTVGGLNGKITGITDTTVTLEIAEKVRVKVGRSYIAGLASKEPEPAKK